MDDNLALALFGPPRDPFEGVPRYQRVSAALSLIRFGRSKLYGLIRQGRIRAVKIDATTFIDMQSVSALFAKAPEIAPFEHRESITAEQLGFPTQPADPLADLHLGPSELFCLNIAR